MRLLIKKGKRPRPRETITEGTFGKKLAEHHREMLRRMFPKKRGH